MAAASPFDEYLSWRSPEPLSVSEPSSALHRQLLQLADCARPRQAEVDQRRDAALRVLALAQKTLGQHATIAVFGSSTTSLALPGSDLDVTIHVLDAESEEQRMMAFCGSAGSSGWLNASQRRQRDYERLSAFHDEVEEEAARGTVRDVEFRRCAKVPVVTFVDGCTNLSLDVSVEATDGPRSSAAVRAALMTAPEVAPIAIALKIALAQAGLNKPFHGGVGPFLTCAMVIDAMRLLGGPTLSCCEEVVSSGAEDCLRSRGAEGAGSSSSGGGASSRSSHCSGSGYNAPAPVDLGALLQSVLAVYASHDEHHLHLYDAVTGRELGGAAWAWPRVAEELRRWQERLTAEGCLSAMLHGWPQRRELLPCREALDAICAYRRPSSAPRVHRGSLSRGGGGSPWRSRESRSWSRARHGPRPRSSRPRSRSCSRSRSRHRRRRARRNSRSRSRSANREDDREERGGWRRRRLSHSSSSSSSSERRRRRRSTSRPRQGSSRSRSRSDRGVDRRRARRRFKESAEEA